MVALMETYTFVFTAADFQDLMKGKSGVAVPAVQLFDRVAKLNAAGHHVRIIEKNTGELLHEFLPKSTQ
jgi:hypothetical protein